MARTSVKFRTPGGATRRSIDSLSGIRYAVVKEGFKSTAVLIRGYEDYRCSKCKSSDCKHALIAADTIDVELRGV